MHKEKKLDLLLLFFYAFAFSILGYILLNNSSPAAENAINANISEKKLTKKNEFGLYTDSLNVKIGRIKPNETISSIFSKAGVADATVYYLQSKFNNIFDFRMVVSGRKYRLYTSSDPTGSLKYFIYEKNPVNYVVIDLDDTLNVYKGRRKINFRRKEVSGTIRYSLYTALQRNEADPELFVNLSDIFAWQIDFYHIQKGDKFKVIYEEESVGSKVIGIGKIMGAYFNHMGEEYYAIDFNSKGQDEYFDENGKSLRKEFLKAPLKYSRISSHFSRKRFHPILKRYKAHLGTDYAAPAGTPIRSVGDGVVAAVSYSSGNGRYVKIRHNSVYTTQYLHMSRYAKGIRNGVSVKQGEIIGYVGSTGLATGPHLCYRFWKNGVQVNPLKEKMPPSKPIDEKYKDEFLKIKDSMISDLNKIEYSDSVYTAIASGI